MRPLIWSGAGQGLMVRALMRPLAANWKRNVRVTGQIPHAALTVCRVRAQPDELRQRFVGRRGQDDAVEDVLREGEAMDVSGFAGLCIGASAPGGGRCCRRTRPAPLYAIPARTAETRPRTSSTLSVTMVCIDSSTSKA